MSHEYFFTRRAATFQWEGYHCPSSAERALTFVFGPWHSLAHLSPLREKEAPTCAGSSPHLCLITLVPAGPAGESAEQNPASEPEGDAGDVTGGGDPGSALSSGTETPADRMGVPPGRALPGHVFPPALEPSWNPSGPEKGKDESKRGKYSQGSSRLLKELVKEMERQRVELTNKVSRMHCRKKAAIPHCQSRAEERRQRQQLSCQG
ncbi:uncharacterized protein LOC121112031 [Gallus gallus]|uniref:uncharacterized protein LOC121112031 n=1 Tax=Gallus gallus TaxID=9031 RepID=UPI001AE96F5E|nr:uncharacterized protein LOC121112031 [Gallus gallus]